MKKRGVGIAAAHYPTGLSGGGDATEAHVRVNTNGSVDLSLSSVDLGQGCKTIVAQIAAEELGIPYEQVRVQDQGTDEVPECAGTGGSRVTYSAGNAVIGAAREARSVLFETAARALGASPEELVTGDSRISVEADPSRSLAFADVANRAEAFTGQPVVGRGRFARDLSLPDPETGECDPFCTLAWGATLAEVEVDTETGEVAVLKLVSAFDAGKAINPLLVEGQIEGGAIMGLGAAMMESLYPSYPYPDGQPESLHTYLIPTAADIPETMEAVIVECASSGGPYGAKGIGEMTGNVSAPAIVSAIHDAVGVWIHEIPVTPELVLRAMKEQHA